MSDFIPTLSQVWNPSGGNGHGTVLARAVSSDTPRLLIAAHRFYPASKKS